MPSFKPSRKRFDIMWSGPTYFSSHTSSFCLNDELTLGPFCCTLSNKNSLSESSYIQFIQNDLNCMLYKHHTVS